MKTPNHNFSPVTIRRERLSLLTLHKKVPQEDGSGFLRTVETTEYLAEISLQYVPITGGINTHARLLRTVREFE